MSVLFFLIRGPSGLEPRGLGKGLAFEWWQPSLARLRPPGPKTKAHLAYAAMRTLGVFSNGGYSALCIRDKAGAVVHRSSVFPGFFRFPFMAPDDLQVGMTWTAEPYRGQGLAAAALAKVVAERASATCAIWYLTSEDNMASRRVAERAGFALVGRGAKRPRLGLGALGYFGLDQP